MSRHKSGSDIYLTDDHEHAKHYSIDSQTGKSYPYETEIAQNIGNSYVLSANSVTLTDEEK